MKKILALLGILAIIVLLVGTVIAKNNDFGNPNKPDTDDDNPGLAKGHDNDDSNDDDGTDDTNGEDDEGEGNYSGASYFSSSGGSGETNTNQNTNQNTNYDEKNPPEGRPFQELWDKIEELEARLDNCGCVICVDKDGDGYDICDPSYPGDTDGEPADCEDTDVDINPGATEICNDLDDDCDGEIDEDWPLGDSCTVGEGECENTGVYVCTLDQLGAECDAVPGTSSPEICNGLDDDCDGTVDDGNPDGGATCDTGELGVCAPGTTQCTGGALVCVRDVEPSAETCNDLDDDCDGEIDEDFTNLGLDCDGPDSDLCQEGTYVCTADGSGIECADYTGDTLEICDGEDNDCDGTIDEGCP